MFYLLRNSLDTRKPVRHIEYLNNSMRFPIKKFLWYSNNGTCSSINYNALNDKRQIKKYCYILGRDIIDDFIIINVIMFNFIKYLLNFLQVFIIFLKQCLI